MAFDSERSRRPAILNAIRAADRLVYEMQKNQLTEYAKENWVRFAKKRGGPRPQ